MERFCDGDSAAFDALFGRYSREIHRFLTRVVHDPALAEDLTQVTFLSLVRSRDRYLRGSRVSPWLYAIATNAARDSLRHRRRRPEDLTRDGETPRDAAEAPSTFRDPGLEKLVSAALEKLPASQREAVVLHRFHGLSFAEIAEALGTSVGAVKVRAHRGYEKLRELLQGLSEEGEG